MVGINMDGPTRDRVMKLMDVKDRIEREIRDQTAVLETNNVGMHDPLVDGDGFPRNDIDVYKVRHARHRIICLQNDHKALMKRIEQGLTEVHAELRGEIQHASNNGQASSSNNGQTNGHSNGVQNGMHSSDDIVSQNATAFATIGAVHNGSPADVAGLCVNDEILQFGSVNASNFNDVTQINSIVTHSVNQRILVQVRRGHNVLNLNVVPRPWSQPGLLGCQILRINP